MGAHAVRPYREAWEDDLDTVKIVEYNLYSVKMERDEYHHGDLKNALIEAGIEILAEEGVGGLSLRKAARRAGVSHAAPYAHFADKQALVAAISTEGQRIISERIERRVHGIVDPLEQLILTAWIYIDFAVHRSAHFKTTFSGAVEKESDYPALVEIIRQNFESVCRIVERCQAAGVLSSGPSDLVTVGVWSQVHGLASLMLEGQISHTVLDRLTVKELLINCMQQVVRVPIDAGILDPYQEGE